MTRPLALIIEDDPQLNTIMSKTRIILTTADERQAETLREEEDIVLLKPVSPSQLKELALRLRSM